MRLKKLLAGIAAASVAAAALVPVTSERYLLPGTSMIAEAAESSVKFIDSAGYGEGMYASWSPVSGASGYNVYVDGNKIDAMLIRQYQGYYRADMVGLKAGNHTMKVVPVINGKEDTSKAGEKSASVYAHDRSGFGFVNGTSSGAYNEDGTLKSNAVVVYVTNANKDSVTAMLNTDGKGEVECKGVQNIILGYKKKKETRPLCLRFIGNITDPAVLTKGDLYIDTAVAGMTIEGIGNDTVFNGFGLVMKNVSNVEVRNIGFMNCNSDEGDDCGLQQGNDHVWVHNCDFFYGDAGSDADQVKGDGALDTKKSSYVTHSYNHFWDNGKCNLQGMKDETTENYITYHHNWYDHSDSRHPRIRTCTVHIYNNYYDGNAKYGVGMTLGGSAFVENNNFRNCKYPMLISMQGSDVAGSNQPTFSKEDGGVIKAYGNVMTGQTGFIPYSQNNTDFDAYDASSKTEKVPATVKAKQGGTTYNNFDTASTMYKYTPEAASAVPASVTSKAGRVNGGDLKWTFDASEDANYSVIPGLKSALTSYKGSVLAIGSGFSSAGESGTPAVTTTTTTKPNVTTTTTKATTTGGSSSTPSNPSNPSSAGTYVHDFTANGANSSYYTINGSLSTSKGTVNYAGKTLTQCLKLETATSVTFNAANAGKLTLVFVEEAPTIKIDGTKQTGTGQVMEFDLSAGSHTITKANTANLFYMIYAENGGSAPVVTTAPNPTTTAPNPTTTTTASQAAPVTTGSQTSPSVPGETIGSVIYAGPNGSASGKGTQDAPYDVPTAISKVQPGGAILLLGGTYELDKTVLIEQNNCGTAGKYKTIMPVSGAKVVWDFSKMAVSGSNRGVVLDGSWWRFYGFEITKAGDNGMLLSGNNNRIELMQFNDNQDTGLQISRYRTDAANMADWPTNNLILNCTAKNNCDDATMENADGFAAKLTCGEGNVFDGCMSYNNSDDGWDLFAKSATGPIGVVTIRNCIAFRNGYTEFGEGFGDCDGNGFKLGGSGVGSAHIVENCLAFENLNCGFTDNNNPKLGSLTNCTAYNNGIGGTKPNMSCYRCTDPGAAFKNCLTYVNENRMKASFPGGEAKYKVSNDKFEGTMENTIFYNGKLLYQKDKATVANGYKGGTAVTLSEDMFVSLDVAAYKSGYDFHTQWRNADGTINTHGFAQVKSGNTYQTLGAKVDQGGTASPAPTVSDNPSAPPVTADFTPGDVNNDGKINVFDLVALKRHAINDMLSAYAPEPHASAMDVDGDGFVRVSDIVLLNRFLLGDKSVTFKKYQG